MTTVEEISEAIRRLPKRELTKFRKWFVAYDAAAWDRKLERDVAERRLDSLGRETLTDLRAGRCTDL